MLPSGTPEVTVCSTGLALFTWFDIAKLSSSGTILPVMQKHWCPVIWQGVFNGLYYRKLCSFQGG